MQFRRSIYANLDIDKGEKFSKHNIKVVRPGFGLHPIYYERLIGKKSPFKIKYLEALNKSIIKALKIKI